MPITKITIGLTQTVPITKMAYESNRIYHEDCDLIKLDRSCNKNGDLTKLDQAYHEDGNPRQYPFLFFFINLFTLCLFFLCPNSLV